MMFGILFTILAASLIFGAFQLSRIGTVSIAKASKPSPEAQKAALHIKHGPHAGKSFSLKKLPIVIGRDTQNDICINDPHVISYHAQIYSKQNRYYLRDLGGGTFINGHPVKRSTVVLRPGDVVRLGKSVLFVFG
jgi:hypothetical protein